MLELKFEKWVDVLLELNNEKPKYLKEICDNVKITWSHGSKIINKLIKKEFVVKEIPSFNSRIRLYTLTIKGKEIQKYLKSAAIILNDGVI